MHSIIPDHSDEQAVELITAYLRGELDDTEKSAVEAKRVTDPAFNALFKAYVKLAAATRESGMESKLEMLRDHAQTTPQLTVSSPLRRRIIVRVAAAAVILLLLAAAVRYALPQKHDRIFTEHFSNQIIPGKGELSGSQSDDAKAFDFYAREQYAQAATEFDQLAVAHPDNDYLLYAAVSHLGAGHLDRAAELLEQCFIDFPNNKPEIIELQALVQVRRGNLQGARNILEVNSALIPQNRDLEKLYSTLQESK